MEKKPAIEFYKRVRKSRNCWEWAGAVNSNGYGKFYYQRKQFLAHRYILCGEEKGIDGRYVLHTCDNRLCVNPKHLYFGTQTQNMIDRVNHGTVIRGEQVKGSKLTKVQVMEIISAKKNGENTEELARQYGVHKHHINRIARGTRWQWINVLV
jgi:hypothetical protein